MRRLPLLWIAACAVLMVAGSTVPVWLLSVALVSAVVFAIPLGIERYRRERNLARALWRLLRTR